MHIIPICVCSIATSSEVSPSDQRGAFINVDLISLLQNKFQNIIDLSSRLLQSNDIKRVTKYKKISKNSSNNTTSLSKQTT